MINAHRGEGSSPFVTSLKAPDRIHPCRADDTAPRVPWPAAIRATPRAATTPRRRTPSKSAERCTARPRPHAATETPPACTRGMPAAARLHRAGSRIWRGQGCRCTRSAGFLERPLDLPKDACHLAVEACMLHLQRRPSRMQNYVDRKRELPGVAAHALPQPPLDPVAIDCLAQHLAHG